MKHYVYRITNTKLRKYYYGLRSSKNRLPENDIGCIYFSSSRDSDFIQDQKDNPQNYSYKVVKKFNTRVEASNFEIKIHNKLKVGINENFYNKACNTSTKFGYISCNPNERSQKAANTMTKNGTYITTMEKRKKTINKEFIDKNGNITTIKKQTSISSSKTMAKIFIDENGDETSINKQRIAKAAKTRKINGKFFNLYHINSGLVKENISLNDLKKITQKLNLFNSKNNYFGQSQKSRNILIKNGKEKLIGLYSIEISN